MYDAVYVVTNHKVTFREAPTSEDLLKSFKEDKEASEKKSNKGTKKKREGVNLLFKTIKV